MTATRFGKMPTTAVRRLISLLSRSSGLVLRITDLGPNLTPIGSVATLLWFVLLRQRGLEVSTWSYIRIGLIVTPATILAALGVALLLGVPRVSR